MPFLNVVDPAFAFTAPETLAAQAQDWYADSPIGLIVLRYAEDLSEAATAELMGCSIATVQSQTLRGKARMRTALGRTAAITVLEELR